MHDLATSGQAAWAPHRTAVSKAEILLAAALGMAYTVLWAMDAGKGVTWDEKNYHYYNVYAWLSNRMDYHLAPADTSLDRPAINYVTGREIIVDFVEQQVTKVNVVEQASGVYLEPTPVTANDTSRASSTTPARTTPAAGQSQTRPSSPTPAPPTQARPPVRRPRSR